MKNIERAKNYQKKLYLAVGREWNESNFKKYWEGGLFGEEWDSIYDQGLLENDFCAWCGNDEIITGYSRNPSFSSRGAYVTICDDCYNEATSGGSVTTQNTLKSGCFIATAAFENPNHPNIILLKSFRDNQLSRYCLGRFFIRLYYFISPPIAKIIARNDVIRSFVKNKIINNLVVLLKKK